MLTPQQYEAIGRFILGFNEIEYLFEIYTANARGILNGPNQSPFADTSPFSKKAECYEGLVDSMEQRYPELSEPSNRVREAIQEAKSIAAARNRYAHTNAVWTIEGADQSLNVVLTGRRGTFKYDEAELADLSQRVNTLAGRLVSEFGEFQRALDEARKADIASQDQAHPS